MTDRVHIDVETRSRVDLRRTNARIYADDPSTELLVVRWAVNDSPIHEWLPIYDKRCPDDLFRLLFCGGDHVMVAHNAQFEMSILTGEHLRKRHGFDGKLARERWECTAAKAARHGLPRALGMAAEALDLPVQKDMEGHKLMMKMCKPRKITEDDEVIWWESKEQVARLSAYCEIDVITEREIDQALGNLPDKEQKIWLLTEKMNDIGLRIDTEFVKDAIYTARYAKVALDREMKAVTGGAVSTCQQVLNLRQWCQDRGYFIPEHGQEEDVKLDKNAIETVLKEGVEDHAVKTALELRLAGSRTSVAKYKAMQSRADRNGFVGQNLMYYGATTGRWSGAGMQPQNFPRKTIDDWIGARLLIGKYADGLATIKDIERRFDTDIMTLLSRMLRGTIIAPKGYQLVWGDYSQIEARGVAWAADSKVLMKLFTEKGLVYEDMASRIYSKPIAEITKDGKERFTGKTAVLGCGYGMGGPKFQMTCERMGVMIEEDEALRAVDTYRSVNHEIPSFWRSIEDTAKEAIRHPGVVKSFQFGNGPQVLFLMRKDKSFLQMMLPSGRTIFYPKASIQEVKIREDWTRESVMYWTMDGYTRKWKEKPIWGGHFTENYVQGFCRDIMADAMLTCDAEGLTPVLTVHDEIVCIAPLEMDDAETKLSEIMTERANWFANLPVEAETNSGERYGK